MGKPRFLITFIGNILNKKLFYNDLSILKVLASFCIYMIGYSLYKINNVTTLLSKSGLDKTYIQEKIIEKHLCERHTYMFLTIFIMLVVINKLSSLYSSYWPVRDTYNKEIKNSTMTN